MKPASWLLHLGVFPIPNACSGKKRNAFWTTTVKGLTVLLGSFCVCVFNRRESQACLSHTFDINVTCRTRLVTCRARAAKCCPERIIFCRMQRNFVISSNSDDRHGVKNLAHRAGKIGIDTTPFNLQRFFVWSWFWCYYPLFLRQMISLALCIKPGFASEME